MKKCYMCEKEATSKEHVPPKCLFPEPKDIKGLNFKKDLITVPSCEIHNMSKSNDDEFLMLSLSGIINNNLVGKIMFYTKANRAYKRKEQDFLNKQILRNHKISSIKTIDNKYTITSIGTPNYGRLVKCFENISFGIYYHEYLKKFEGEIKIFLGFIEYANKTEQTLKLFLKRRYEMEEELLEEIKGKNPEVFFYQFCKPDKSGLIALRLVFYGKSEVFISYKPKESTLPFDLISEMIKGGFKTTLKLGDENFEFN